jgi:hypothetical protein
VNLFRFIPGYETAIYESGREPALVMLVAFLITFALTRGYTRIARVRGWGSAHVGSVHMHHLVVGLVLTLVAGALEFAFLPDEGLFQLLLVFHLDDVYWEGEGRKSVDAVVLSVVLGAVFLLHSAPLGLDTEGPRWIITIGVIVNLCFVLISALKGKLFLATFGVFLAVLALIGAVRLAEPGSVWARRRYPSGSEKMARSLERYEARWKPLKERAWDLIGGKTGRPEEG